MAEESLPADRASTWDPLRDRFGHAGRQPIPVDANPVRSRFHRRATKRRRRLPFAIHANPVRTRLRSRARRRRGCRRRRWRRWWRHYSRRQPIAVHADPVRSRFNRGAITEVPGGGVGVGVGVGGGGTTPRQLPFTQTQSGPGLIVVQPVGGGVGVGVGGGGGRRRGPRDPIAVHANPVRARLDGRAPGGRRRGRRRARRCWSRRGRRSRRRSLRLPPGPPLVEVVCTDNELTDLKALLNDVAHPLPFVEAPARTHLPATPGPRVTRLPYRKPRLFSSVPSMLSEGS